MFCQVRKTMFPIGFLCILHFEERHGETVNILMVPLMLCLISAKTLPGYFINDKVYKGSANAFFVVRK